MLGRALYAQVKAINPRVGQLGHGVSLLDANYRNAVQEARVSPATALQNRLRPSGRFLALDYLRKRIAEASGVLNFSWRASKMRIRTIETPRLAGAR